jgi:hypothetical protein
MTTYRLLIAIKHALPNWPFVDFMKQHSIADYLVALKIGKLTRHGLAGDT